ncbi:MAG: NUDIX domain-containing protein [Gammaproteobacteria bacterium]|nr:NUDIX domain-containing protein [Gammaproteobacteria bacterium]
MIQPTDYPHVTAAAIIHRDGKFLIVEERSEGRVVLNQPAGHLEIGESLTEAIIREVREESCYLFTPEYVSGIYHYVAGKNITYLRLAFVGTVGEQLPELELDEAIIATHWMSLDELQAVPERLRTPLVVDAINDYLAGQQIPLSMIPKLFLPENSPK